MVFTEMRYPNMREELIEYLCSLADRDYQESVWVRNEVSPGIVHDEMDYAIHFLYDDTCLATDPSAAIGWFLKDEAEAEAIRSLVRRLNAVFAKYGRDLNDEAYINKPEWLDVLRAAEISKALFLSSN